MYILLHYLNLVLCAMVKVKRKRDGMEFKMSRIRDEIIL